MTSTASDAAAAATATATAATEYKLPRVKWADVRPGTVVRSTSPMYRGLAVRLADGAGRHPTASDTGLAKWSWPHRNDDVDEVEIIEVGLSADYAEAWSRLPTSVAERWASYRVPNARCEDVESCSLVFRCGSQRWTLVITRDGHDGAMNVGQCAMYGHAFNWTVGRDTTHGDMCHVAATNLTPVEIDELIELVTSDFGAIEAWLETRGTAAPAASATPARVKLGETPPCCVCTEVKHPDYIFVITADHRCRLLGLHADTGVNAEAYAWTITGTVVECEVVIVARDLHTDDIADLLRMTHEQARAWLRNRGVEVAAHGFEER